MLNRSFANLALIGFMGVGKSTLGRHLAKILKYRFVDTDHLIESRTGKKIASIFSEEGEDHFRLLEQRLVEEMSLWKKVVISTGGGLVTRHNNLEILKQYAFVACLWASPETIFQRVKNGRGRPLLQTQNPLKTIDRLLSERASFYKRADCIFSIDKRSMRIIAHLISQQYLKSIDKSVDKNMTEKSNLKCKHQLPKHRS